MTNNAKIGGILTIICGAFGVLGLFAFIFSIIFMRWIFTNTPDLYGSTMSLEELDYFITIIYGAMGVGYALLGVLAIVGGVYALKRRHWGLALAGAIAGVIVFFPCGIPAIIFTTIARPEFAAAGTSGVIAT
jgi:hypothetical protein